MQFHLHAWLWPVQNTSVQFPPKVTILASLTRILNPENVWRGGGGIIPLKIGYCMRSIYITNQCHFIFFACPNNVSSIETAINTTINSNAVQITQLVFL
jgi:hypothetical protein